MTTRECAENRDGDQRQAVVNNTQTMFKISVFRKRQIISSLLLATQGLRSCNHSFVTHVKPIAPYILKKIKYRWSTISSVLDHNFNGIS
jgi:hypothetical protein